MTILESLREKKKDLDKAVYSPMSKDLFNQYDLALENALLKLGNRGVQIADLKNKVKALTIRVYTAERILSRFNVLCAGCNSLKEVNR